MNRLQQLRHENFRLLKKATSDYQCRQYVANIHFLTALIRGGAAWLK